MVAPRAAVARINPFTAIRQVIGPTQLRDWGGTKTSRVSRPEVAAREGMVLLAD